MDKPLKKCVNCDAELSRRASGRDSRFCQKRECRTARMRAWREAKTRTTCLNCGTELKAHRDDARYCMKPECRVALATEWRDAQPKKPKPVCECCGKEMLRASATGVCQRTRECTNEYARRLRGARTDDEHQAVLTRRRVKRTPYGALAAAMRAELAERERKAKRAEQQRQRIARLAEADPEAARQRKAKRAEAERQRRAELARLQAADEELQRQKAEEKRARREELARRAELDRQKYAERMAAVAAAQEVTDLAERARELASNPKEAEQLLADLLWRQRFEEDRRRRGIPPGGKMVREMQVTA
jgi:hypothetical protein